MIALLKRERRAAAADDTEAVRSITRLRMRLTVGAIIALVITFLIYFFAFGWYRQSGFGLGLGNYAYSTLFNIIFWEFFAAQFVILVCAYRGKMNASSRFADQAYLKRFSRKLLWATLAVVALTAAIFLLLKYA